MKDLKVIIRSVAILSVVSIVLFGMSGISFAGVDKAISENPHKAAAVKGDGEHRTAGKMETATGKVASVDPQGKAITVMAKSGTKGMIDVGTIVNKETVVKVKGKTASLKNIKPGDTVTVHYMKTNDLYAKEIMKG
jgi:hypothetical protein